MFEHLRTEATQDALERSIKTMEAWAEDKESVFNHYFCYVNSNIQSQDITTGRISSWIIYNCTSGQEALNKLNTEQIEMVFHILIRTSGNVNLWTTLLILNG